MRATSKWTGAVNTGPKGVLADYEATFAAGPTKQASKGSKGVLTDWRNNEEGRGRVPGTKQHGAENGDEEEPERDDFVDEWRRRRIEELSNSQDKKRYGQLREINEETFLAAIEDPSDAWVVLHLYEPVRFASSPSTYTLTDTIGQGRTCMPAAQPMFGKCGSSVSVHQVRADASDRSRICDRQRARNAADAAHLSPWRTGAHSRSCGSRDGTCLRTSSRRAPLKVGSLSDCTFGSLI